ncbi:MAG TPA: hypothetical protein VGQ83_31840 [Polyangia bacterium]|jgi:hypothetical protein
MRGVAIVPLARAVLNELRPEDRESILEDLRELEQAAGQPGFVPTDWGIVVRGFSEVYRSPVGRRGRWRAYWQLPPADPRPLHHVIVLEIETAAPPLVL